jgi:calpain-7
VFHVQLDDGSDDNALLVDLRGPKEFSIGFEVTLVSSTRENQQFENKNSGAFRPVIFQGKLMKSFGISRRGYTVLQLEGLPAGVYSIRPMTFTAGQEGPFILSVKSSCNFNLKRVQ